MSEELQACKRRAIEKIKAMRAITAKEHEARYCARVRVQQRQVDDRHLGRRPEAIHGYIIREALRNHLGAFFTYNKPATEWVGTEDELIDLIDLPEISVRSHYEYLRRVALDKYLGCVMLSFYLWSFPRFEVINPTDKQL